MNKDRLLKQQIFYKRVAFFSVGFALALLAGILFGN